MKGPRCSYTWLVRLLIVIGAAIVLAGILTNLFGVRTSSTWSGEEYLNKNEYLAVMLWSLTSQGRADIKVKDARNVLYATVKGNPLALVMNSSAFGVKIERTETHHDFRAGVFYAYAKVSMDPIALAFLASRFKKGSSFMNLTIQPSESLILLIIPEKFNENVYINIAYHLNEYKRLGLRDSIALGTSLSLLGVLISCVGTKVSNRKR